VAGPLALLFFAVGARARTPPPAAVCSPLVPTTWRVTRRINRDGACFTQGLFFRGRELVESCGLYGASLVRTVSLANGSFVETSRAQNNASDFGQGAALWPPVEAPAAAFFLQLTWQQQAIVVWDAATLQPYARASFASIRGEGWGLTSDGVGQLVMTDGTANLFFLAPDVAAAVATGAFAPLQPPLPVVDAIPHADGWVPQGSAPDGAGWAPRALARPKQPAGIVFGSPVPSLNELEWAHGWVLANIWCDARVAIIHPASGAVVWYLDFAQLLAENAGADCTNGLAYTMRLDIVGAPEAPHRIDGAPWGGRLWVTGKFWTHIYEVELGAFVNASLLATPALPDCPATIASPSSSPAPPSPSSTASPSAAASPSSSPAGALSAPPTLTRSGTVLRTRTGTVTPSRTVTPTRTLTPAATPSTTTMLTATRSPSQTRTQTGTVTQTRAGTLTPSTASGSSGAPGRGLVAALASAAVAGGLAAVGYAAVVWKRRAAAIAARRLTINNAELAEPLMAT
jgi:glutamine cyclotransferase